MKCIIEWKSRKVWTCKTFIKNGGFARLHAAAVTWEIDTHAINRVMPQSIDDAVQSRAIFSQSTDRYLEQGRNTK